MKLFHCNTEILNFLKTLGIIHFNLSDPTKINLSSETNLILLGVNGSFKSNPLDTQEFIFFLNGNGRMGINSFSDTIPVSEGDIVFFQKGELYYLNTDEGIIAIRETTKEIDLNEIEKLIANLAK